MRFLRTVSTARLLAAIAATLVGACAAAAIAVAAVGSGPVPRPRSLAGAVHRALGAHPVAGVSADITFTDNLIDSTDFTGQASDPLLQGASGRLWAGDGRLRIELQSGDGDAQIVVDHGSFWISDPTQNAVWEGTLPAGSPMTTHRGGVPTIASIQTALTRLARVVDVSGAQPTDVAGKAAYRVTISPRPGSGGLLSEVALAWDAARGVPLSFDVYARGDAQPVLGLTATHVSYGAVAASVFSIAPPAGATVTRLGTLGAPRAAAAVGHHRRPVTGLRSVAARLPFALRAPATLAGLPRGAVRLLDRDAAILDYGHGLGAITVIESRASAGDRSMPTSAGGLSLPTRQVAGATATVLSTPLGTVLHLDRGGVSDTVIGSVASATALRAADGLFS